MRSKGHRVFAALSIVKKQGLSDKRHIEESGEHKAILITFDKDFKIDDSLKARAVKSAGVIVISIGLPKEKDVKKILLKMLGFLSKNQIASKVCEISQGKITLYE